MPRVVDNRVMDPVLAMAGLNVNQVLRHPCEAGGRDTPATHGTAADAFSVDSDGLHGKFHAIADCLGAHRLDKTILVSPAVQVFRKQRRAESAFGARVCTWLCLFTVRGHPQIELRHPLLKLTNQRSCCDTRCVALAHSILFLSGNLNGCAATRILAALAARCRN